MIWNAKAAQTDSSAALPVGSVIELVGGVPCGLTVNGVAWVTGPWMAPAE
jgi:hypothetical protein